MKNSKSVRKNKSEIFSPENLTKKGQPPKLLLHTCCADCAVKSFSAIREGNEFEGEIILYYANSNIHPRTEWLARLEAVKKVAGDLGLKLIVGDWSPKKWFAAIGDGGVVEKAGLSRCQKCWKFRLSQASNRAVKIGATYFSTTLLSSKHMSRKTIEKIGGRLENRKLKFMKFEIAEACSDNVKDDDAENTGRLAFYRQNYCGCIYSLKERYEEKFSV